MKTYKIKIPFFFSNQTKSRGIHYIEELVANNMVKINNMKNKTQTGNTS